MRHVPIESLRCIASCHEIFRNFGGGIFSAGKNKYCPKRFDLEDTGKDILFLVGTQIEKALADIRCIFPLYLNGDFNGFVEMFVRQFADRLGHGGGEKCGLAIFGGLLKNPLDILNEAHAQHFIGFVQHQGFHLIKLHVLLLYMVHHPAGCAYHNLGTSF